MSFYRALPVEVTTLPHAREIDREEMTSNLGPVQLSGCQRPTQASGDLVNAKYKVLLTMWR
jgi:hypothetical protein